MFLHLRAITLHTEPSPQPKCILLNANVSAVAEMPLSVRTLQVSRGKEEGPREEGRRGEGREGRQLMQNAAVTSKGITDGLPWSQTLVGMPNAQRFRLPPSTMFPCGNSFIVFTVTKQRKS